MQELIDNTVNKEIHELKANEFLRFDDYISHRMKFDRYTSAGVSIPSNIIDPIDQCVFPVGCKMWRSAQPNLDMSVFTLKEFDLSEVNIRSQKYPESQEHLLGRNTKIDYFVELYKSGTEFPPLIGYQNGNDIYLVDGNRRFLAAKKANIQKLKVFVEELDENALTKNRADYVQEAIDSGHQVDQEIISEIEKCQAGKELRTTFRYSEKRRNEYPAIGDQLDQIHKFLRGQPNKIQELWDKIDAIKQNYPKP
jgi:hypothetical protein